MRKALVFKERLPRPDREWNWTHQCRSVYEPGGYLEVSGQGYKSHALAITSAHWHVAMLCRGERQFKERT